MTTMKCSVLIYSKRLAVSSSFYIYTIILGILKNCFSFRIGTPTYWERSSKSISCTLWTSRPFLEVFSSNFTQCWAEISQNEWSLTAISDG